MEYIDELRLPGKYPTNLRFERTTNFFEKKLYGEGRIVITYCTGKEAYIYDGIKAICSFARSAKFLLDCLSFFNSIKSDYDFIYKDEFKKDIRDIILASNIYAFRNYPSTYQQEVHFINYTSTSYNSNHISEFLTDKCKHRNINGIIFNLHPDNPRFRDSVEIHFSYPFDDKDHSENVNIDGYSLYDWFRIMIGYYAMNYKGSLLGWFQKQDVLINNLLEKELYVIHPHL